MKKILLSSALALGSLVSIGQINGLVAKYPFNNKSGLPEIGSVTLTLQGNMASTADRFGNPARAIAFDGVDDYVDLGSSALFKQTSGTVSIWVNRSGNAGTNQALSYDPIIVAKNTSTLGSFEAYLIANKRSDGSLIGGCTSSPPSVEKYVTSPNAMPLNAWQHLVLAYNTDSVYVYMNGQLVNKITKGFASTFSSTAPSLLGYSGNTTYKGYFKGSMDDLRIYNRVLTPSEISLIYNETNPYAESQEPVAKYYFNAGTAVDEVGKNDGTVVGASLTSDRFGNPNMAYSFDGINDYINIGRSEVLKPSKASISLWVNRAGIASSSTNFNYDPIIMAKNSLASGYFEGYSMGVGRSDIKALVVTTQPSPQIEKFIKSGSGLNNATWYHLVMTYDDASLKFYINGQLVNTVSKGFTSYFDPGFDVLLGHSGAGGITGYFSGVIDDIRFYNRVITPNEVALLYAEPNPVVTATESEQAASVISLFPNPSNGVISVSEPSDVLVFDATGNLVLTIKNTSVIDLSNLHSGMYMIELRNVNNQVIQRSKVVKE